MGSLALKSLNENCSTKPKRIPVTKDIILFKDYCHEVASKAIENLKIDSHDTVSFKNLSEACLALTIVKNKKRVGDVQYLKRKYIHYLKQIFIKNMK